MNAFAPDPAPEKPREHGMTRERVVAWSLVVATVIVFYLCYCVIQPFLPALAWALALAVIAFPVHTRLLRWVKWKNVAAGLTCAFVVLVIIAPVGILSQSLIRHASHYVEIAHDKVTSGAWRESIDKNPRLRPVWQWIESQMTPSFPARDDKERQKPSDETGTDEKMSETDEKKSEPVAKTPVPLPGQGMSAMGRAASLLTSGLGIAVSSTVWVATQLLITIMCLFFFLRDREDALNVIRSLMPLSHAESSEVFTRVDDTIHATIFGSLVVAMVQGFMGGLMFWWLGLPSPVFWGALMGMLATVPVLGTFIIWAPTAVLLALQGDVGKALILASWGGIAIALVDNFLYPYLVGNKLRFHTLLVFFFLVGGLALFGASGLILGPLLLAVTDALLDVWRRRTSHGGTIEAPRVLV
jgi:predicted PurR-regulated permease PerM